MRQKEQEQEGRFSLWAYWAQVKCLASRRASRLSDQPLKKIGPEKKKEQENKKRGEKKIETDQADR